MSNILSEKRERERNRRGIPLKEVKQGAVIRFSNRQWIVLDPKEGYLWSKKRLKARAFDPNNSQTFNPSRKGSVAHFLNSTFYETFTEKEKCLIDLYDWEIGGHRDESENTISAKIGLISVSEWLKWSEVHEYKKGFLKTPLIFKHWAWTRTPNLYDQSYVWSIDPQGFLISCISKDHRGIAVKPALKINPNTLVIPRKEFDWKNPLKDSMRFKIDAD